MESWLLLGAGAIVLIGITLWIVWPARSADTVDPIVRAEEVPTTKMTESNRPVLPPQGDRFEDQYTSATADLSAGGVATAFEAMHNDPPNPVTPYPERTMQPGQPSQAAGMASSRPDLWPQAHSAGERIGQPSQSDNFPYGLPATETHSFVQPKSIGIGAGALLSLGGAIGGAWLYARWQHERNRPLNRLRRGARDVASRLGDRLPDVVDDLPRGAAPMSGVATAVLLSGLMLSRALRHESNDVTDVVRDRASGMVSDALREALGHGRDTLDEQSRRLPVDAWSARLQGIEPRKPAVMGVGFGGLAVVAGGCYLVWRLLRGGGSQSPPPWYAGQ